jgi:tetratricopeptide (TPR) repeat protein
VRLALFLIVGWNLDAADWLQEAKERGAGLENERHWTAAAGIYEAALARLGPDGPAKDRFWLLTSLAELAFERQEYVAGGGWLRKAEDTLRGLDENTPERVRLLNAWGTLHLVEGNLTAAERDLSRAVALSEFVASPPDVAAALHNLAAVEMHTGRLWEAAAHETRALTIWKREFGGRHRYVMKALISLSSLQGLSGNWLAAEASLKDALRIAETPEALANYAVVLEKLKRPKEASEIRRQVHVPMPSPSLLVDVKAMPLERERTSVRTR